MKTQTDKCRNGMHLNQVPGWSKNMDMQGCVDQELWIDVNESQSEDGNDVYVVSIRVSRTFVVRKQEISELEKNLCQAVQCSYSLN